MIHYMITEHNVDVNTPIKGVATPSLQTSLGYSPRFVVESPLIFAIAHGSDEAAITLIKAGAGVLAKGGNGWEPLHLAARNGLTTFMGYVLENQEINWQTEGEKIIYGAAITGKLEILKLVFKKLGRSMLTVTSLQGLPLLHQASTQDRPEMMIWLINEVGVDPMERCAQMGGQMGPHRFLSSSLY